MNADHGATWSLTRRRLLQSLPALASAPLFGCAEKGKATRPLQPRSWRMGFSPNPPRLTVGDVVRGIDLWSQRAEYAIIHEELPWTDLLAGMPPDAILARDKVDLVAYLRSKGLELIFMGDLNDGLAREQEAAKLRAAGRSITEPAVQQLYRDYLLAVHRVLAPAIIGLVAESNLIRAAAPSGLYAAVVQTANDTAVALRNAGASMPLMASVQVETAWGRLGGNGAYLGVEQDFVDFPFLQVLGLSSYPYFGWSEPEALPTDYYQRLLGSRTVETMMVEGGWASASSGSFTSSPEAQARYVRKHTELLDAVGATAWLHLLFADLDLASLPPPVPPNLPLFSTIGLTDSDFQAKPALAAWDEAFARPLVS